jgi:hypothetical protein
VVSPLCRCPRRLRSRRDKGRPLSLPGRRRALWPRPLIAWNQHEYPPRPHFSRGLTLNVPAGGGEGGCLVWCRGGFGASNVAEFVVSTRSSSTSAMPTTRRMTSVSASCSTKAGSRASMKQAAGRRVSPITLSAVLGSARVRRECARHQRTQPRRVHRQVQTQTPVGLHSVGIGMILCSALSPSRRKNFR